MTIKELNEKRTKLLLDAKAIMESGNATAEQRTQVDAMYADANNLKADITRIQAIEEETRSTSSYSVPRGTPGADVAETRSADERREATNKALRSYLRGEKFEARDLTVASNGAVTIPVGVTDPKVALKSAGSIYDLVGKLRTSTGEAIKLPLLNDTGQSWVLNSASITTTDPTVSGVTISIDDIRMNPILIENSLIQDVTFDLVSYVTTNANLRYERTVSNWITNGNSSNVGSLAAITAGVTSTTTLVLKYADFVAMVVALDPAYTSNAVWTMNLKTQGAVASILDSNGRPLFQPFNTTGISGFTGTILGFPVKTNVYLPDYAAVGATAVQFGDYAQAYTLREVEPGIMFKRTSERYVELNKSGFLAFARVGGAVTDAGTHPVVTLTGR